MFAGGSRRGLVGKERRFGTPRAPEVTGGLQVTWARNQDEVLFFPILHLLYPEMTPGTQIPQVLQGHARQVAMPCMMRPQIQAA